MAYDYREELEVVLSSSELNVTYELPDGTELDLNENRIFVP